MVAKVQDHADWYDRQLTRWDLAERLLGGTEAMRQAGPKYLTQFPQEPKEAYEIRLANSVLTGFYSQIAARMIGMIFREAVEVKDSLIDPELLSNIDGAGRDVSAFAYEIAMPTLTRGMHHIFVDAPTNPGAETAAHDQALGLRPVWVSVPAEACFNAFATRVGQAETLSQVRYKSDTTVLADWDVQSVKRIMVLQLVNGVATYQMHVEQADGSFRPDPEMNGVFSGVGGAPLDKLPWAPIYGARREGFFSARSIIQDIAYKNVEHWQSASDQRNILTVSRYPMMTQVNVSGPITTRGPHSLLWASPPDGKDGFEAKFGYIEPQGNGIQAGERDLERIIADAEMLAIQLQVDPSKTATGARIDMGSSTAGLVAFAHGLEQGLTRALQLTGAYYGLSPTESGYVQVNKDFALTTDKQARIEALLEMSKSGKLSDLTLWDEMRELGVLSDRFDPEVESHRVQTGDMLVIDNTPVTDAIS